MDELTANRQIGDMIFSPVTLGTMRFLDKGRTKDELIDLFSYLYHELGVNTHHSSYEYNSYQLYCEALLDFKRKSGVHVNHIVKLSSPGFKEKKFDKVVLRERILSELKHLATDRVEVVQWLYRSEPIDDKVRIPGLNDSIGEINAAFNDFIKEGIIGTVGTFPYSIDFGKEVSGKVDANTGWVTYLNLLERENIDNLPKGQWLIGIRPLAAGRIKEAISQLNEETYNKLVHKDEFSKDESILNIALGYCLQFPEVISNILSVNSIDQAKSLGKVLDKLTPLNDQQQAVLLEVLE